MNKKIFFTFFFLFFTNNANAYLDPVTTGIIYQIIFFLLAGFLAFFSKAKKLLFFLSSEFKHSKKIVILLSIFPFWFFLSDFNKEEFFLASIIFFILPATLIYLILMMIGNKKKINNLILSIIIIFGLDQTLGFASIINIFRIMDDLLRYFFYLFLFLFFICLMFFLISKKNTIVNFIIIILLASNVFNLFSEERNLKNFNDYEIIKNNLSDIKIERVVNIADPTIVIILDEMNGLGGLNDKIINTKTTKKKINNFIKKFNFTHYPNAYTIYSRSSDSIPSYLNFHYEYNIEKLEKFRKPHNNSFAFYEKVLSNKLFDLYNPKKVYVKQTFGLDFCAYENFQECKTTNPFSRKNKYINNFKLNNYDKIFSKFSYQTSIFATLLTRTLRQFDLIKIIEPRIIGKTTIEQNLDNLFIQAKSKKFSLIFAHLLAPHKPFVWDLNGCGYKYYENQNFISDKKLQEYHNVEIQCLIYFLDKFFTKLNENKIINHYDIVIASDHGARNLNFDTNKKDWHSVIYLERKKNNNFKEHLDAKSSQLLFYNFFNENKINDIDSKIYDHKNSKYIFKSNIF